MPAPVGEPLGAHAAANAPATTSPSVVEEDVIIDYLQNNLSAAERESFERRLADDSDARKVVAALAGLSIFSSTLPANAPKSERAGSEGARGEGAAVPSPGEVLVDKYRVVAQLGRGAMGVVLEVEHVLLGERYALKLLRGGSAADKSSVQRLVREARAAMRIDSPHVARVFDLGVLTDGRLFLVMELLTGRDLRSILADEGALPVERAILYLRQAALGVRAAHAAGVVHRDLKPANLFVARTEQGECLKVVDFGLSKAPDVHRRAADDAALTTSGSVIGSPMYMAPEQIRDPKSADARSDVWALGVVLYEMVTGTPPYSARTVAGVLAAIMVDAPRPLDETRIPAGLRRTIGDCLAKDPDQRIQSAEMLLQRLQGQDDDRRDEPRAPRPSRARGWMAAASVLVAAVAALASVSAGARSAAIPARTLALPSEAMSRAASFAVTTAAPAAPISPVPAVPTAPESSVAVPVAAVRPRPAKPPTPAPTASSSADAPLDVVFGKETEQRQ